MIMCDIGTARCAIDCVKPRYQEPNFEVSMADLKVPHSMFLSFAWPGKALVSGVQNQSLLEHHLDFRSFPSCCYFSATKS